MRQRGKVLDGAERAREKRMARDADARAVALGQKSAADVRRANGKFAFPHVRIRLDAVRSFT